ncbi:LuxR C-terminal-related transcriptional regulator [Nonomuraea jiangxiensis]|uniref:DNA-binding response regulator, NarL/FixJ family, contains REC and HTH domains n=1 Tax=Nonomuraea jiangxiensis TaxID=633440 RepID=A0A1G9PVR0_9ACTN|nr:response regulator transcription factor [Nonomuraea jiangxiensis]SDM02327.1 DNA-binding response regulator, NarL/FixJ family, contains REC and HTH domains [Nonomuraea jiangxiensis]
MTLSAMRDENTAANGRRAGQPMFTDLALLIVDDVCLYREGLASVLARQDGIGKVLTAIDTATAVAAVTAEVPDLVLANVDVLSDGVLLGAAAALTPAPRTIALGVSESEAEVVACAEAGVHGYLLRSESLDHLLRLMRAVAAGETLCSPRMTALLMRRVATLASERRPVPRAPALTDREDQVLGLLDLGLSNQEIGDRLGIGVRTVKNHVHHILEKTGARRRGEAVANFRRTRRAPAD